MPEKKNNIRRIDNLKTNLLGLGRKGPLQNKAGEIEKVNQQSRRQFLSILGVTGMMALLNEASLE